MHYPNHLPQFVTPINRETPVICRTPTITPPHYPNRLPQRLPQELTPIHYPNQKAKAF
jgi:hypothetical protein